MNSPFVMLLSSLTQDQQDIKTTKATVLAAIITQLFASVPRFYQLSCDLFGGAKVNNPMIGFPMFFIQILPTPEQTSAETTWIALLALCDLWSCLL